MTNTSLKWIIIGTGRVGKTLLLLAQKLGIEVQFSWSLHHDLEPEYKAISNTHYVGELPQTEAFKKSIVFLSVVDDAISKTAASLKGLSEARALFHLSGLLSSAILRELNLNIPCASIHPVVAVSDPHKAISIFSEIFWSIEGDPEAIRWGKDILKRIDVVPVEIDPKAKPLYHAAAVFSAGQLVSLIDAAILVAMEAGLSRPEARRMLLALSQSAVDNLKDCSTLDALTGPLSRGDSGVIKIHEEALASLENTHPLDIYKTLTEYMAQRLESERGD